MYPMNVFDEEARLCDAPIAETISLLAMAGLTLDELRAYWRLHLIHLQWVGPTR